MSEITAWGVQWTGLPHSPKTNRDCLIEDNLLHYRTPHVVISLTIFHDQQGNQPLPQDCSSRDSHCVLTHYLTYVQLSLSPSSIEKSSDRLLTNSKEEPVSYTCTYRCPSIWYFKMNSYRQKATYMQQTMFVLQFCNWASYAYVC